MPVPNNYRERRHCFVEEAHDAHVWEPVERHAYWCDGAATRPDPQTVGQEYPIAICNRGELHGPHQYFSGGILHRCPGIESIFQVEAPYVTAPEDKVNDASPEWYASHGATIAIPVIAGPTTNGLGKTLPGDGDTPNAERAYRPEYGDPLQNMREQAAMFEAYRSGRPITAIDVPVFFILAKLHRMGKMPDYKDNYNDVRGYLDMAEGLIGDDMIDADTAKQYRYIKEAKANIAAGLPPEEVIPQELVNEIRKRSL